MLVAASGCATDGATPAQSPPRTAPASAAPSTATSVVPEPSGSAATTGAVADLDLFLELLESIHPEPFHGVTRDEFVVRLREIQGSLADSTPEETMVAVMGLVAMLSHEGRDGHQLAIPTNGGPMLPIRVFEFGDGVFITDAMDTGLVGARITALAGRPVEDVLGLLEPLVPRDSPATVPGLRPFFLLRADVLQGLGLIEGDGVVPITVDDGQGTRDVDLETIPQAEFEAWAGPFGVIHLPPRDGLRFTDADAPLLEVERLSDGALYVKLREVRAVPISEMDAFQEALEDPAVSKVIFDLRHNPGGDNTTYPFLLQTIQDIEQPLWVLTDRRTFSAASNLSTEIEQSTDARFAGEPMGGGLNFWDDVDFVELASLPIPMSVGISTVYHQKSFADDPRLTIEPDLLVPYRSAEYFAGIDLALQAVLSAP